MIQIDQLSKNFGDRKILENFNLTIADHEFVCFLGPSGCGKSTLLRLIAGLEQPSSGQIIFPNGRKNKPMSFVFQDSQLLDWRNVEENILLPIEISKSLIPKERLKHLLDTTFLSASTKLFPHELSGGMKMRTSLARALISEPQLLLLDEPFAALDESTRFELQDQLLLLHRKNKMTTVFVTHSISEAVYLSDRVALLSKNGGSILCEQQIQFSQQRNELLRTSAELNSYVSLLSAKLRAAK